MIMFISRWGWLLIDMAFSRVDIDYMVDNTLCQHKI